MLIINRKRFNLGLFMTVSFLIILFVMFMPLFDGHNAFVAADRLFNSISKASSDYTAGLAPLVDSQRDKQVVLTPKLDAADSQALESMLNKVGIPAAIASESLTVTTGFGALLDQVIQESRLMFNNRGEEIEQTYGMPPLKAAYLWWKLLKATEKQFKDEKDFKSAAVVAEVNSKALEVAYNYYGIEPQPARQHAGILTFSLIFYVVYTLWWGYAIFFLAEGVGLAMTKGAKKEV